MDCLTSRTLGRQRASGRQQLWRRSIIFHLLDPQLQLIIRFVIAIDFGYCLFHSVRLSSVSFSAPLLDDLPAQIDKAFVAQQIDILGPLVRILEQVQLVRPRLLVYESSPQGALAVFARV